MFRFFPALNNLAEVLLFCMEAGKVIQGRDVRAADIGLIRRLLEDNPDRPPASAKR